MNAHEIYIKRCLELAKNGLPSAMPNPSVGAVIVYQNKIIGEGYTSKYGGNHAEVNAINSVKDKLLLCKSTLYVSLEPCSHFGKTPPCADLIIKNKIENVVIGTLDSNEKVAGEGIKKLVEAGINVTVGVLEKECKDINKRFFTFHEQKRPYIILKWAESLDGFIAPISRENQEPIWITNFISRQLVHKWRSEEQAILVGTKTVLDDNPKLDVRDWNGKNPTRIILDKSLKISSDYNVKDKKVNTIIITEQENFQSSDYLHYEKCIFDNQLVTRICEILYKNNIQSVLIEGGTKTIQSFIDATIWDEARIFKGTIIFENGTKAPILNYKNATKQTIINDELLTIYKV